MRTFGIIVASLIGIPAAVLGFLFLIITSMYNGLVTAEETVNRSYAQVQNVMQRQADLIPNLVETVKGYATHERGTLETVIQARAKVDALSKIDVTKLANDPALQKQLIDAQAQMRSGALATLNAVTEAYPNLKADAQFASLMASLEGSQNRITVERRNNQLAVETFNRSVRQFPRALVADYFGFAPKTYFQASDAAQVAPQVKF